MCVKYITMVFLLEIIQTVLHIEKCYYLPNIYSTNCTRFLLIICDTVQSVI